MFQDYLDLLPQYQGLDSLAGVTCVRPFFGFVPNWIDSPLRPITSRLLHIGDAAGNRSQLSFAGESARSHLSDFPFGPLFVLIPFATGSHALHSHSHAFRCKTAEALDCAPTHSLAFAPQLQ